MKWNQKLSLTMIAGLAVILPVSAFAKDDNQDDNNQGKKGDRGHQKGGRGAGQGTPLVATPAGGKFHGGKGRNAAVGVNVAPNVQAHASRATFAPAAPAAVRQSNVQPVAPQNVQSNGRRERNQQVQVQVQPSQPGRPTGNRDNHYGGLWFAADSHRDWDRNGQHRWNNRDYRWYDGGWLVIDTGYSHSRSYGNSIAMNVQRRLTEQGYYRGPIDGDIGPGSRKAIANYQMDHDLRVSGRINDALLEALRRG